MIKGETHEGHRKREDRFEANWRGEPARSKKEAKSQGSLSKAQLIAGKSRRFEEPEMEWGGGRRKNQWGGKKNRSPGQALQKDSARRKRRKGHKPKNRTVEKKEGGPPSYS